MTLSLVLEKWLDSRKPRLAPGTTDRYRVAIKHIDAVIGSIKVARLRPHHIEDFYADLCADGQSGSSIRKVHLALRQSLAWANRRGYSSIIATEGIELPPLGAKEIEPPSSADVRKVIDKLLAKDPDWARSWPSLPGPAAAVGKLLASTGRMSISRKAIFYFDVR
jgi:hypothetical protein